MPTTLINHLKHRLALPLPGKEAQYKMANMERKLSLNSYKTLGAARWGSVLILLYEEDDTIRFPLILRADYEGVHSGQVAFPGGKFEPEDESLVNTARRETEEEIGVNAHDVEIIGRLTELFIPPSNFLVHPHVGYIAYKPVYVPDPKEVVKVMDVSLDELLDDDLIKEKEIRLSNGLVIRTPTFYFNGETVWGATAMILSELKAILFEMGV